MELLDSIAVDERIVVIGASLDRNIEAAMKFAKDNELDWVNCYVQPDRRVRVAEDYAPSGFPTTVVIGPDGRILAIRPSPLLLQSTLEDALRTK